MSLSRVGIPFEAPGTVRSHSLQWFETQDWPFRYEIEPFRVIGNTFMRSYVSDGWTGKLFLEGVFALQQIAPSYCGRYGQMPAIILRKDRAAVREAE